jgi:hypothetical protein
VLDIKLSETIHDREIRMDNGWVIKIGRGLGFYQKPDGWFAVGANDFAKMTVRRWCHVLTLSLMTSLFFSPRPTYSQEDPLRHGYALIISVWDYQDKSWDKLPDIELQATQLEEAFKPHFDAVYRLNNPDHELLLERLRWFLRDLSDEYASRLLIYYSGHGLTRPDSPQGNYRGYITAYDTPARGQTATEARTQTRMAVSMEEIRELLKKSRATQVLMIFDSCFAGAILGTRNPPASPARLDDQDIRHLLGKPVRQFLTAGDETDLVPAHSPIPQLIIQGIDGKADPYSPGVVTATALGSYLFAGVAALGDVRLTPKVGKLDYAIFNQGEFMFRVHPQAHQSPPGNLTEKRTEWRRFYMRDMSPKYYGDARRGFTNIVNAGSFAAWDLQRALLFQQKLCGQFPDIDFGLINSLPPVGYDPFYFRYHINVARGIPDDTAEWVAKKIELLNVHGGLPYEAR